LLVLVGNHIEIAQSPVDKHLIEDGWHILTFIDHQEVFFVDGLTSCMRLNCGLYRFPVKRAIIIAAGGLNSGGGRMQDDLTDATRWAIAQGHADPARICIYGASYGGYAALMGVAKDPDLYKCAFGYVGLYDVQIQKKFSDTADWYAGQSFFERTFGATRAEQDAISPVNHAHKIKAAVYLAAGARDQRCPPEHTEAMRDALIKAGNPPEGVIIQSGEMHGFYDEKNNLKLYTEMLAFFGRHIGGKVQVGDAKRE